MGKVFRFFRRLGGARADRNAEALQQRFGGFSDQEITGRGRFREEHVSVTLRRIRRAGQARDLLIGIGLLGFLTLGIHFAAIHKRWSFGETARHLLASPNCNAARLMRLAPARRGRPGYYVHHDADFDGLACEPLPR